MSATRTPAATSTRNRGPGGTPDRGVHRLIVGTGDNGTTYGCALSCADIGRVGAALPASMSAVIAPQRIPRQVHREGVRVARLAISVVWTHTTTTRRWSASPTGGVLNQRSAAPHLH
jgi:hypothetical protein